MNFISLDVAPSFAGALKGKIQALPHPEFAIPAGIKLYLQNP
jgi:hypothetical protein